MKKLAVLTLLISAMPLKFFAACEPRAIVCEEQTCKNSFCMCKPCECDPCCCSKEDCSCEGDDCGKRKSE